MGSFTACVAGTSTINHQRARGMAPSVIHHRLRLQQQDPFTYRYMLRIPPTGKSILSNGVCLQVYLSLKCAVISSDCGEFLLDARNLTDSVPSGLQVSA